MSDAASKHSRMSTTLLATALIAAGNVPSAAAMTPALPARSTKREPTLNDKMRLAAAQEKRERRKAKRVEQLEKADRT